MLIFKYSFFATIAILINLLTQECVFLTFKEDSLLIIAILAGTFTGLITKYILDKKFVFYHSSKNFYHNFNDFVKYTMISVFTTIIFWGSEYVFYIVFNDKLLTYVGAIIGLVIGYIIKYQLDKRFVFK